MVSPQVQKTLIDMGHSSHLIHVHMCGNACRAHCETCGWDGHKHRFLFCPSAHAYQRAVSEGFRHESDNTR